MSDEALIEKNAVEIVRQMQKLRGIDGEYDSESASSNRLAHRKTIHMLEKQRNKKRAIGTLDVAFKKRFFALSGAGQDPAVEGKVARKNNDFLQRLVTGIALVQMNKIESKEENETECTVEETVDASASDSSDSETDYHEEYEKELGAGGCSWGTAGSEVSGLEFGPVIPNRLQRYFSNFLGWQMSARHSTPVPTIEEKDEDESDSSSGSDENDSDKDDEEEEDPAIAEYLKRMS